MARPSLSYILLYGVLFELQLITMVTSESRGDEFKMEPGELELLYDETLDHYVIQIEQNESAILQCTSPESTTLLINEGNKSQACVQDEELIYDRNYVGDITLSCILQVQYREAVQWFSCILANFPDSKTIIRIAVVPAKPGNPTELIPIFEGNSTLDLEQDMSWWCLSDTTPIFKPSAGHLLYFKWYYSEEERVSKGVSRPMLKVKKVELWKKEISDTFRCNGTNYILDAEFHCFGKLPTGLPSIQHCHDWGKAMVVLLEVLLYVLLYATLVGLYKSFRALRRAMSKVQGRTQKDHIKYKILPLPLIKGKRPYAGIDNPQKLIIRLDQPETGKSCDLQSGRFKELMASV
ncbi:hypothetical protein ACHWQZ_G000758 [Mnemiopsis leidyi]